MRRSLVLVLPLLAAAAVPARADYPPTDCTAQLVLAAAGSETGCTTIGGTPLYGGDHRVLRLVVASGAATATLGCGGATGPEYRTLSLAAPGVATATLPRTSYCWVVLHADADGTTAVAANTTGRTEA
jgi:hypothetical protein